MAILLESELRSIFATTVATPAGTFGTFWNIVKADAIASDLAVSSMLGVGATMASAVAAVAGTGLSSFATTADLMARLHCE